MQIFFINGLLIVLLTIFSKEIILLNEEIVLLFSFSLFFYYMYVILKNVISNFLLERTFEIKKNYIDLYNKKIENLIFNKKLNSQLIHLDLLLIEQSVLFILGRFLLEKKHNFYIKYNVYYLSHLCLFSYNHTQLKFLTNLEEKILTVKFDYKIRK